MTGTDLCVNLATSVPVIFEPTCMSRFSIKRLSDTFNHLRTIFPSFYAFPDRLKRSLVQDRIFYSAFMSMVMNILVT